MNLKNFILGTIILIGIVLFLNLFFKFLSGYILAFLGAIFVIIIAVSAGIVLSKKRT